MGTREDGRRGDMAEEYTRGEVGFNWAGGGGGRGRREYATVEGRG
jgi:hypothetical protein